MVRQLISLLPECSTDAAVQAALRMAIIGSTEMAGHLSRWDRWYLKSYEAMAGHRFNLTTLAVEPNVWGTEVSGRGTVLRRLGHLVRAAEWLHSRTGGPLTVELCRIGDTDTLAEMPKAAVRVVEGSSERMLLASQSVDLVLTDPPYHDDVQYSELSLPLRAWAGLDNGVLAGEAVVNATTGQLTGVGQYEQLLTRIYSESRRVLREDGHLIFSYANRAPGLGGASGRASGCWAQGIGIRNRSLRERDGPGEAQRPGLHDGPDPRPCPDRHEAAAAASQRRNGERPRDCLPSPRR